VRGGRIIAVRLQGAGAIVVAPMTIIATVLALAFGAADQYLGSLSAHGWGVWTVAVSQMSATWLLLPFLAGLTRERAGPAARLGLLVTYAGLLGYFVMTLSPVEGVALSHVHLAAFLRSQSDLLVGGMVTGPLFGYLGHRWRVSRSWASALLIAGAACGEPLARALVGRLDPPTLVWVTEVALGATTAAYFAIAGVAYRRRLGRGSA
jgi:hypothetical protein